MIRRILLNAALNTLTTLLMGLVQTEDLRRVLQTILDFVEDVVAALTDNNKNDKEQVHSIWRTRRQEIAVAAVDLIEIVIKDKIQEPELRESALIQTKALRDILTSILN
jgi:folylpolyglutamate synthase/dihydropteroate synthase